MGRSELGWISCPVCCAGSPAGISICPRCRYRFRVLAGRRPPEFDPNQTQPAVSDRPRARGQFTLATGSLVVAAVAVMLAWPILILPAGVALWIWLLDRAGLPLIASVTLLCTIGIVLGLALCLIMSH